MAVTGFLLALCYPPVGWGWVAHIALAPAAVVALRSGKPKRLILSSFAVALVWWLVMMSWLAQVTVGGYVVLCAAMALYWPATWVVYRLLAAGWRLPSLVALPMAWVCFEFIRAHLLAGGLSWFELGHTQAGYEPGAGVSRLIQVADLFGEHAVSFVVAASSGLIVDLLTRPLVKRRSKRPMQKLVVVWLIIVVGALGYGQYRINTTPPLEKSLTVAVVQTNMPQDNKERPTRASIQHFWQQTLDLVRQAAAATPKPQLIVIPETMVPAALNRDAVNYYTTARTGQRGMERFYHEVRALASELNAPLLLGGHAMYEWVDVPTGKPGEVLVLPKMRFNSAFLVDPDPRTPLGQYDKVHRVPFGEYLPWVDSLPALKRVFIKHMTPYDFDYSLTPGKAYTVLECGDVSLATPICFEDAVARVARRMAYDKQGGKRADVLINLTNDGWYPGSAQGYQHVQIATLRCVELRVPMARSVNTGVSGFIDSLGRVTGQVTVDGESQQVAGVASAALALDPRTTLFGRLGETPMWLLTGVTLMLAIGVVLRARR